MEIQWNDRQLALRKQYREAARDLVRPSAAARDAGQLFERALWRQVAETGLLGLYWPVWAGGKDLSLWDSVAAFEGFASGCEDPGFLVSLVSHMGLVQASLATFGTEEQQRQWMPGLIDGSLIGCFAITEHGCGSDVRAMQLGARPHADGGWDLNGAKWNITNAPVADLCVTFGKLLHRVGKPVSAFLVDLRSPGITRSAPFELMGNRTTPVGELRFDNCVVGDDAILGQPGHGLRVLEFAFVLERILTGIGIAGCLEPLLEACLDWVDERKAFGRPIGDFQYVQGHIVEIYTSIELVRSLAWRAIAALSRGEDCSSLASTVKITAAEAFSKATSNAMRVHGNHGYRRGHLAERLCRDASGVLFAGGTAEIHKNVIWRKLQQKRAFEAGSASG